MLKNIFIGVLVVALLVVGSVHFSDGSLLGASGETFRQKASFMEGLSFGTTRQANLARDGSLDVTSLALDTGTAQTEHGCATATWNPLSLGTSTVDLTATTTDIALTGATTADTCSASFTLATTSAASVTCHISGTATATIRLVNYGTSALNLATGTARVCYTAY